MSPANVKYVLEHNPEVSSDKVEIAPNSYDVPQGNGEGSEGREGRESIEGRERVEIRQKYGLPTDRPLFIYGGNMGKPVSRLFGY